MSLIRALLCRNMQRLRAFRVKNYVNCIIPWVKNAEYGQFGLCNSAVPYPKAADGDNKKIYNIVCLDFVRYYGKKGKDSGGKKESTASKKGRGVEKPSVQLTSEELNEVINFDKMKQQMDLALDHLKKEYTEQLAIRTSASMFDSLTVVTADGQFSLLEIAQVVQKNPQLMLINMTATPQYIPQAKTAIANSGMNVNVQQDGTSLFVPIPRVTREHREILAKNAKTLCDKTKDKLRNIQNNFVRELNKSKDDYSQDLIRNLQESILTTTKGFMEVAEGVMKAKQQELLNS